MRHPIKKILLAITLTGMLGACAASVGVVAVAPPPPVYVRPMPPRPGFIWIDGDYFWRGGRYVWRPGYWSAPRYGHSWRPGYWRAAPHGYRWERGRWR